MNSAEREQLLGYLLGALDDADMELVRRKLEHDAQWRAELNRLEAATAPLDRIPDVDPPPGLVQRTCSLVDAFLQEQQVTPAYSRLTEGLRGAARARSSLADFVVAAGIIIASALMFFPAISNSRHLARRTSCQNNLRLIGVALADYSDKTGGGYFPWVPAEGKQAFAGIYAPVLYEAGYLRDSRIVICPASEFAQSNPMYRIPTLSEIEAAEAELLLQLRQRAGGSYGYNLGIVVNGRHVAPRNQGRAHFAIAGDAPGVMWANYRSSSHVGGGSNLLYEDGHVGYLVEPDPELDDPFRNRFGVIEAGIGANDAVIAPSFYPPFMDRGRDL